MKQVILVLAALAVSPAHAQLYKWTDANGKVHYSDRPQDGVKATEMRVQRPSPAVSVRDNWQERERESRASRAKGNEVERRAAAAAEAEARKPAYNPSADRSTAPLTDDDICRRDRQQIEFAEKTKVLAIGHGSGTPVKLTEEQRQAVIAVSDRQPDSPPRRPGDFGANGGKFPVHMFAHRIKPSIGMIAQLVEPLAKPDLLRLDLM